VRSRLADPTPRGPPGALSFLRLSLTPRICTLGLSGAVASHDRVPTEYLVQPVEQVSMLASLGCGTARARLASGSSVGPIWPAPQMLCRVTADTGGSNAGGRGRRLRPHCSVPVTVTRGWPPQLEAARLSLRLYEIFDRTGHPVHPDAGCRQSLGRGESVVRLAVDPRPTARPPLLVRPSRGPLGSHPSPANRHNNQAPAGEMSGKPVVHA